MPVPVLGETPGAWDNLYTCNPQVVKGSFVNPLGNGATYSYAMYYVALGTTPGTNNFIGVAFSNDGISWKKYPRPIIGAETQDGYGVGQPAAYNTDQHAAIRLFYEDWSFYVHHVDAISTDGVHFTAVGVLSTNGLDRENPDWVTSLTTPRAAIGTPPSIPRIAIRRPQEGLSNGLLTASSFTGFRMRPF